MAFIPDEAILNFHQLTPAEIKVYCFYCKTRDRKTGGWKCSDSFVGKEINLSRNRVFEARKSLEVKGWIRIGKELFVMPIYGFKVFENSNTKDKNSKNMFENSNTFVENSNTFVENSNTFVENSNTHIRNNQPNYQPNYQPSYQNSAFSENGNAPIKKKPSAESLLDTGAETQRNDETAIPSKPVEKPKAEKNPRGTRIPDDFALTDEMREWAKETTPDVDVERETDEFVDYWKSVSTRATKRDWFRTWKTRMREIQRRYDENARRAQLWREQRERERSENQTNPVRNKTDVIKQYDYSEFDSIEFH